MHIRLRLLTNHAREASTACMFSCFASMCLKLHANTVHKLGFNWMNVCPSRIENCMNVQYILVHILGLQLHAYLVSMSTEYAFFSMYWAHVCIIRPSTECMLVSMAWKFHAYCTFQYIRPSTECIASMCRKLHACTLYSICSMPSSACMILYSPYVKDCMHIVQYLCTNISLHLPIMG